MIRFILVMVPLVFLINGLTKGDWEEAFFFALAVAVGLTPEMLPMIVAVCLSKGAVAMSRKKVIVKRLNSIQNLGAMDVLCTDKTGTLTQDRVILERHCDVSGRRTRRCSALAYLNSHFQTGPEEPAGPGRSSSTRSCTGTRHVPSYAKVDEIPFDFSRRLHVGRRQTARRPPPADLQGRGRGGLQGAAPASSWTARPACSMTSSSRRPASEEYDALSADGFRVAGPGVQGPGRRSRPTRRTTRRT